ncbi:MAG TPA: class I SAM-dependent methyltransferase [Myxococcaceae bacterium]|nr:class I SAM-dependent methyltransferase [Myxococcaceae bacterium]
MRRAIINLLRCPRCHRGALLPEADTAEVVFGPLRCPECQAGFPVAEGVADLVTDRSTSSQGAMQRGLEQPLAARSYERYLRPAMQFAVARRRYDRESELLLYRSLLGTPDGPVLDVACGTGLFARTLARELSLPPVVGMDVARAMIEEGMAQAREAGVMVDFVRAEAPELPFQDQSFGAVLQTGALHLIADAARMFLEVGRVLRPGGRYVASTYTPPGPLLTRLHRRAGLHPRTEDELRSAIAAAGLVNFERLILPPFILVKGEKPARK